MSGKYVRAFGAEPDQDIVTAAFLMDPRDARWQSHPEFKEWATFMDKLYPEGNKKTVLSALSWATCHTMIDVLRRASGNLGAENVMKAATSIKELRVPLLLPGITINTSPTDYYPIETMQLQRINGDRWESLGEPISVESE